MRTPFIKLILLAFLINTLGPLPVEAEGFVLPKPGVMVHLSPAYNSAVLKGIKVHPENPFKFEFILDPGDAKLSSPKSEANKLIKYFLASLTVPEKDLWVNLSPYEKDRIVPEGFGQTEMGRDLLAQDYLLKQITASLMYPEDEVGKKFWKRIYEEAAKKYGTTHVPINTFNKVWIVPEKAVVYENAKSGTAYVVESKLKVMLESDYLSQEKNMSSPNVSVGDPEFQKQIIKDILIPELEKEVNQGKNFAQLRQVYQSLILATWYKKKIKESILSKVYTDKNKIKGTEYIDSVIKPRQPGDIVSLGAINAPIESVSPSRSQAKELLNMKGKAGTSQGNPHNDVDQIYHQYLQAFKKGAVNLIKEEQDPITQQVIPRKYFSGGWIGLKQSDLAITSDAAMVLNSHQSFKVDVDLKMLDNAQLAKIKEPVMGISFKQQLEDIQEILHGSLIFEHLKFFYNFTLKANRAVFQKPNQFSLHRMLKANEKLYEHYLVLKEFNQTLADEFYKQATQMLWEAMIRIEGVNPKVFESVKDDPVKLNNRIATTYAYMMNHDKPFPEIMEGAEFDKDLPVIGWDTIRPDKQLMQTIIYQQDYFKNFNLVFFSEADLFDYPDQTVVYVRSGFISHNGQIIFAVFKNPVKLDLASNRNDFLSPDSVANLGESSHQGRLLSARTMALMRDKVLQAKFFKKYNINTPKNMEIELTWIRMKHLLILNELRSFSKRVVVKPNKGRQGKGIRFFDNYDISGIMSHVQNLLEQRQLGEKVIVQEKVVNPVSIRAEVYKDIDGQIRGRVRILKGLDTVKDVQSLQLEVNLLMKRLYIALEEETQEDSVFITADLMIDQSGQPTILEFNPGQFSFYGIQDKKQIEYMNKKVMLDVFKVLIQRAKVNKDRAMGSIPLANGAKVDPLV